MKEAKFSKSLLKRNNAVGITHGTNSATKSTIVKTFMKTKQSYKKELFKNMRMLMDNKIDRDKYIELQKSAISKHFTESYLLGKRFNQSTETTLSDSERRFIVYQTTEEMKYMSNFADDIINNGGKMPYRRRMNMYAAGLDPMFKLGDIAYLPEDMQIEWVLGITDKHCFDCLNFAMNSPYTKKTLPGIPKSCNSACLSNCRCSLNYYTDYVNTRYTNFIIDNYTDVRDIVPNENDFNYIDAEQKKYYDNRLMYEMTKLDKYFDAAKESKVKVGSYITSRNLAVFVPMYIGVSLLELKKFKNSDSFAFVENTSNVFKNDMVSFFNGGKQIYGKVSSVSGNTIVINTMFKETFELDVTQTPVFVEVTQ